MDKYVQPFSAWMAKQICPLHKSSKGRIFVALHIRNMSKGNDESVLSAEICFSCLSHLTSSVTQSKTKNNKKQNTEEVLKSLSDNI